MTDNPTPTPPSPTPPSMTGGVSQDEITQATLSWALAIVAGFIPPLIFFLIAKDKPFVHRHAAMGLTLSISVYVLIFVCAITVVGVILIPFVGLFALVINIMGAIAANKGQSYDPPIIGGLAKSLFKVS